MSKDHKLEILKAISQHARVDEPTIFSFDWLSKETNLSREQLDSLMTELKKERSITDFILQGNDNYSVILHQNGLDLLQENTEK